MLVRSAYVLKLKKPFVFHSFDIRGVLLSRKRSEIKLIIDAVNKKRHGMLLQLRH